MNDLVLSLASITNACLNLGFPFRCKPWNLTQMQIVYLQRIPGDTAGGGKGGQEREHYRATPAEGKWHPGPLGNPGSPSESPQLWGQRVEETGHVSITSLPSPPLAEGRLSLAFVAGYHPQEILLHQRTGLGI